jgi:protein-disulfide isomerase
MNKIETKHFVFGALILSLAMIVQPFSLLATQMIVAPKIAPYIMGNQANSADAGATTMAGKEIKSDDLKIRGNKDAKIILVEYSDYECPFCSRFHDTPTEIVADSNGEVSWAWKHFPLTQIHQNARPASIAAECVNKLAGAEKFWQFSDILIANQTKLSDSLYKSEAAKLGLNAAGFASCLKDPAIATIVDENTSEGEDLGVSGTPSTFVVKNEGGKLTILENINGALPKATVESIIAKYTK